MAQTAPSVDIIGLRALARDVKRMPDSAALLTAFREAGRMAADPVATAIRSALPRSDTEHAGRLAGDVRTNATRTGAAIRVGRKTVPYAGPVEFGAWPRGRPFVATGRYIYPTAQGANLSMQALRTYSDAMQAVLDRYDWTNKTLNPEAVHD
jgi:hypothetical protein